MDNITTVITDFFTDMIKKLLITIENKNNRISNLLEELQELENKVMTISIENEELQEKYHSLDQNYNEIETDLINLEKKNYFEKINN